MNTVSLVIKVFIVHLLIRMRLLPNVWYQCEIDLAKIRGAKLAKLFKEWDNEHSNQD